MSTRRAAAGPLSMAAASLWVAACAIAQDLTAQTTAASELVHLDIKGLPVAPISCFQKDRDGALWIGTDNGLCRFDGVNVDAYRNIPGDSTSLPGDFVRDLAMDEHGMIWVSCFGGAAAFDPHLGGRSIAPTFKRKALFDHGERFPSFDAVDLLVDGKGGIWLTCVANGLALYDPTSDLFRTLQGLRNALPNGQSEPFSMGVTRDRDGFVWFTDRISLYRFDPSSHQLERYPTTITANDARKGVHLARLIQDPQEPNSLWLGSRGAGLIHFDKRTGTCENYIITHDGPVNFTNIVSGILPRKNGQLLIAIERELRDFDPGSHRFSAPLNTLEWGSGTFESIGNALMQDDDERIWAGTYTGVFTLPPHSADYRKWKTPAQLLCMANDHPGYWGANQYAHRTLFKLGLQGEVLDSLPLPYSEEHRFEPMSILQTHDGHVLVGTTNGLLVYDPATRSLVRENFMRVEGMPHPRISILSISEGSDGSVWMAFNGKGLLRYRPADAHTNLLIPKVGRSAPAIRRAYRTITEFGRDHFAVTYETGGVGVVDTRTMTLVDLMNYGPRDRALSNISALVTRSDSVLFAVTNNEGIVELWYRNGSLRHANTYVDDKDRINGFGDAAADARGNIWIATNTGVALFRAADHSFQHIGLIDGLGMSSGASIIPDRDSCMLAWNSWCAHFDANTFARPVRATGLYIRSVEARGVPKNGGSPNMLSLPHDSSSIAIAYAPIALLHAEALRYEVLLGGHDAEWVDNGYNRSVSYVGLPPGAYEFHVRIAGRTDPPLHASFGFVIVPAWWQTWWFKVLVALISGTAVFFASRYVLQLRYHDRMVELEREREVNTVRTRIARDIHDDIGSGLTRIAMLSRELDRSKETDDEKGRLAGSIAHASKELIGQLGEIVWTVDPKNDSAENFIAYVRDLLGRQFEELSTELRTDLTVDPGMERRDVPPDVKRNVVMILKETVSNALKHANARTISVTMNIGASELALHVEDDGMGFDPNVGRVGGNGLGNMRKRSEAIGGALALDSGTAGTRYALRVPLPAPTFMREP